jgi:hypothetical protein
MITKLTQQQIDIMPECVDKWLKIGLSTERINGQKAQIIIDAVYKDILDKPMSLWKEL